MSFRAARTQEDVMRELSKIDVEALLEEAYATKYTETKLIYPNYR